MTGKDKNAFATLLFALGETFNEAVSEARAQIYFRAMKHLSLRQVEAAMDAHVRSSQWFPKPAELLGNAHGGTDDHAELAWAVVRREVGRVGWTGTPKFPDAQTHRAAMELFGGWRALCENLPSGGPELLGCRKQFVALYGALARREAGGVLPPNPDEAKAILADLKRQLESRQLTTKGL
jgi:hypothetical protein